MNRTTPQKATVAVLVAQIAANPESAPGADGTHVGYSLLDLFVETAWPSREGQRN